MNNRTVHLFVFDTMADWEAAFAISGINNPQFQTMPGRYRVVTAGLTRDAITTIGGVRIQPDVSLAEVAPRSSSMLILPGGKSWERCANVEAVEKAYDFLAAGVPVAAICAATLALARAGLLNERRHTSNAHSYLESTGYQGGRFYCDVPAITGMNLITASGVAPIDFAREIFAKLNLYSAPALTAWYALFKYGDASKYLDLVQAVTH